LPIQTNESAILNNPRKPAATADLIEAGKVFIHDLMDRRRAGLRRDERARTALLINASRGPIVEEKALISVLRNKKIAGVAIDVFDVEPLPPSHPFRTLDNVLATPHLGYGSQGLYKTFYEDTVASIRKWLDTH
jgi:phosphoglycerate dehydrogenase-like enzyme